MTNSNLAICLSLIAGLSTGIGGLIALFRRAQGNKMIALTLGCSAGVMLSVSFVDLLPHAISALSLDMGNVYGGLFAVLMLLGGVAIAYLIDTAVPDERILLGRYKTSDSASLARLSIFTVMAIILHNFPEGVATFMAAYKDTTLGISVTAAIALHNIPEGIAVAIPIVHSTKSRKKAVGYAFLSGLSEPLGAWMTWMILRSFITDFLLSVVFALVAGIMVYVSFHELLPTAFGRAYKRYAALGAIGGITIMLTAMVII